MKTNHQFLLEKGSKKYPCLNCNKKSFVRFTDTKTGDYLPHQYGRCDRESKCAYYLNPYLDGYVKVIREQEYSNRSVLPDYREPQFMQHKTTKLQSKHTPHPSTQSQPKAVYFDFETFKETLQTERYEKNIFIQNLFNISFPFQTDEVTKVIQLYRLGTIAHGYRAGANTFPFIDINGNIRAVQVKQFDNTNHTTGTDFLHSIIEKHYTKNNTSLPEWLIEYNRNEKKVSCLFGEHLLAQYPLNPVALVEAPKTAVYGTLYFGLPENPENFIWLAVYNKSSFSWDKLKVLQGKDVFIFPDLSKDGSTFREWEIKAKEIEKKLPGTRFIFSDLLEQLAPDSDKNEGYDLADYLIKQDWRLFRKQNPQEKSQSESQFEPQPSKSVIDVIDMDCVELNTKIVLPIESLPAAEVAIKRVYKRQKAQSELWSKEIAELEAFFSDTEIPSIPIQLDFCSTIVDIPKFIKSHLSTIKANNGKRIFSPYLSRLHELKQLLTIK
ncbi:DUF6965 family protein [Chryseobacterium fistulae]|uniref:Uncharacterized protein n=1 Tax=Chryseobacterium fistulae TaxID=2675058 RepID=A0A6N4XS38_9FLAO|nr:DUF6371 domain-containing protein [Chryseobacterium fistulae]CAA7386976.1 hypothetical protein CHRY9393_01277 [Chryseobacterium fistulae]